MGTSKSLSGGTAAIDKAKPIDRLCQQIEQWRKNRRRHEAMPKRLWEMATDLARQQGVSFVSRAARLSYSSLQTRVNRQPGADPERPSNCPTFIELPLSISAPCPECMIEMENSLGSRMRIQVKGMPMPDLMELSRAFWSKEL